MKRIIKGIKTILVAILMVGVVFPSCTVNGVAENSYTERVFEEIDWSSSGFEDVKITYRENITRSSSNIPTVEIDMVFVEAGRIGHYERIGSIGYHYIDGELITQTEYTNSNVRLGVTIPSSLLNYNATAASGFSTFRASGYYPYTIKNLREYVLNYLAEEAIFLMLTGLTGALPGHLYLSAKHFLESVEFAYDYLTSVSNVYDFFNVFDYSEIAIIYQSYHGQCNILAWYGFRSFPVDATSNTAVNSGNLFKKAERHSWNSTPFDYTQPAACRVLEAGDYGY